MILNFPTNSIPQKVNEPTVVQNLVAWTVMEAKGNGMELGVLHDGARKISTISGRTVGRSRAGSRASDFPNG